MNETLKDIHWLMAHVWIAKDGLGIDAYDNPHFKTLAEKYGFNCESYEEARSILEINETN